MNRKGDAEYADDPYDLIRKLRLVIQQQKQTIEQYQLICDSLVNQKLTALNQIAELKKQVQYLTRRIQLKTSIKLNTIQSSQDLFLTKNLSSQFNKSKKLSVNSPIRKNDVSSSHLTLLGSPNEPLIKKQSKIKQFIPGDVKFNTKRQTAIMNSISLNQSSSQAFLESIGDYLAEDYLVIGPEIMELKRMREQHRDEKELRIMQFSYCNWNKNYKSKKSQYLKDVANRSFPLGAIAQRKTIENIEQFKLQMEYVAEGKMNEDFFIINLKGDFNQPPLNDRVFLGNCNPFRALFAVCLRVPDFIPIRDEKYYQRKQQQVWKIEKIYAVLTYYPFIQLHLSALARIHNLLKPNWHNLHREEIFTKNLTRNLTDAQKNEELSKLISYFMSKRPDFNQICQLQSNYFGTLPNFGPTIQYAFPRFACSIFFSIFAYEQLLLLLTALFLEKTIIFVSKSDSAATLCAMFLVTCISPFVYNHHLILNCNTELIENIVFGFPLTLVASIKKSSTNFPNILSTFIENTVNCFKGFQGKDETAPHVLVDIDSNSIFYDHELTKTFQSIIIEPSKEFKEAYHEVNPSHSKSFTFPKKMPVQIPARPRNDYEKNMEEKKKLLKEYQSKIQNNTSKWPTFKVQDSHLRILTLLTDYIQSFSIDRQSFYQLSKHSKQLRIPQAKMILIKKHPDKVKLIEVITKSQIFADYMDQLEKNAKFYHS